MRKSIKGTIQSRIYHKFAIETTNQIDDRVILKFAGYVYHKLDLLVWKQTGKLVIEQLKDFK